MRAKGVAAALLCSTLNAAERKAVLAALQADDLRLLYVTPELLASSWCADKRAQGLEHSGRDLALSAAAQPALSLP